MYYVYCHKYCGEIMYVGKGCGERVFEINCRGDKWKSFYKKNTLIPELLAVNLTEEEALSLEIKLIRVHLPLLNTAYIKPKCIGKQFLITELQAKNLRDLSHKTGKSESDLVRQALDQLL